MSNKFTVIFDYRNARKTRRSGQDHGTVELGPWLDVEANKRRVYNTRCFYVLKPNADDVVKFGIAGLEGKASCWGRLHQYINEYGYATELNPCTGIRLLYLAGNVYNPNVEMTNSAVYRKELACKQYFRDTALKGRGFERILVERLDELFKIVEDKSNKSYEDIETERRTSERLAQAEITPEDAVVRVSKHETKLGKSQAKTQYMVHWSRPYVLTEKKRVKGEITMTTKTVDSTWEPYHKIITYLDGSKAVETYKALHPEAKFRD
jgi:hypothetical protein